MLYENMKVWRSFKKEKKKQKALTLKYIKLSIYNLDESCSSTINQTNPHKHNRNRAQELINDTIINIKHVQNLKTLSSHKSCPDQHETF